MAFQRETVTDLLTTTHEHRCFGGVVSYHEHLSEVCEAPMRFGIYTPPGGWGSRTTFVAGSAANRQGAHLRRRSHQPRTSALTAISPSPRGRTSRPRPRRSPPVSAPKSTHTLKLRFRAVLTGEATEVEPLTGVESDRRLATA